MMGGNLICFFHTEIMYCNILDTIMCCDDFRLLLKIMYTCGAKGVNAKYGKQGDAYNPGRLGRRLATWGSSTLAWD
jgi:hypothetical protein